MLALMVVTLLSRSCPKQPYRPSGFFLGSVSRLRWLHFPAMSNQLLKIPKSRAAFLRAGDKQKVLRSPLFSFSSDILPFPPFPYFPIPCPLSIALTLL